MTTNQSQIDERSHTLFLAWKAAIEQAGYICKPASEIVDRDLLYDALVPDHLRRLIGTPWEDNGEMILVEINRRGVSELVSYAPEQVLLVKREGKR